MAPSPEKITSMTPEQQLALSEIAARNDWSPEQIDIAASELTAVGQEEMQEVQKQMNERDEQLRRGLGLTAEQQMAIDSLAASGADNERIEAVTRRMLVDNESLSV